MNAMKIQITKTRKYKIQPGNVNTLHLRSIYPLKKYNALQCKVMQIQHNMRQMQIINTLDCMIVYCIVAKDAVLCCMCSEHCTFHIVPDHFVGPCMEQHIVLASFLVYKVAVEQK